MEFPLTLNDTLRHRHTFGATDLILTKQKGTWITKCYVIYNMWTSVTPIGDDKFGILGKLKR